MVIKIHGSGGHGRVVADAAELRGHLIRFTDRKDGTRPGNSDWYITAIGDNATRKREQFVGAYRINVIHPQAIVSDYAQLGNGIYIGPGAVVNAGAKIGSGAIINSGAVVEHDCQIGEWSHIAPGAVLCGGVNTGEGVFIGANATVKQGITIHKWAIIGCGAVVIRDVDTAGVFVGNPAKRQE